MDQKKIVDKVLLSNIYTGILLVHDSQSVTEMVHVIEVKMTAQSRACSSVQSTPCTAKEFLNYFSIQKLT